MVAKIKQNDEKIEPEKRRIIVEIDPKEEYARHLHYMEKHSGWQMFKSLYWAVFIFISGAILIYTNGIIDLGVYFGIMLMLFAIFIMVYGFAKALHYKFIKKYG
jgi:hypothetical protein